MYISFKDHILMLIFEHTTSPDKVILRSDKTSVDITFFEKEVDQTFIVSIPSLDIHISTKRKEDIDDLVHGTLVSFFGFWQNAQGVSRLYDHMLELGFSIRKTDDPSKFRSFGLLKGRRVREDLELK
jgi:hypothetical protein